MSVPQLSSPSVTRDGDMPEERQYDITFHTVYHHQSNGNPCNWNGMCHDCQSQDDARSQGIYKNIPYIFFTTYPIFCMGGKRWNTGCFLAGASQK